MISLFARSQDRELRVGWQAGDGYCGSAIGLVEVMRAFRGLSTNVTAAGQRVHFVRRRSDFGERHKAKLNLRSDDGQTGSYSLGRKTGYCPKYRLFGQ
jgi:hypothetical protein